VTRLRVLGLIGAIGAGKTTTSKLLAQLGGVVIDCDRLGHEVLLQPDVIAQLTTIWGGDILAADGSISRRELGRRVFADSAERQKLEAIVFPHIRTLALKGIAASPATARFVVLDAAVLLEAGWATSCEKVLYIDAPVQLRLARLARRSGWDAAELAAREAAQWSAERKKSHADAVLVNDGGEMELASQLEHVLMSWNW